METVILVVVIMGIMAWLMSTPGSQYMPKPEQLGIDPAVQIDEIAKKMRVLDSSFEANTWSFQHVRRRRSAQVTIDLEPSLSDDVRTWAVRRVTLQSDASLPGDVAIGTRSSKSDEPELDVPFPSGFQRAYWVDGSDAEVLATCNAKFCDTLLDAHRDAPRWTHIALGQSSVFERITGTAETFGVLEGNLRALLDGAHACVDAFPGTQNFAALLAERADDDGEPLAVRWRAAHVLLTQMRRSKQGKRLAASLDDLPDPLYPLCAVWDSDCEGDPRDSESALIGALTGELVDDGLPLYLTLSEAGWDPSGAARAELVRRGSPALGDLLREEGGVAGGLLTLADEPAARGGLSQTAEAGGLEVKEE